MLEQAQAELPNECCGLLAGRVADGVGRVEMRYPLVNELTSPVEYSAEAMSLFAAFKDMRALNNKRVENRKAMEAAMEAPTLDPAKIEAVRVEQMKVADESSRRFTKALTRDYAAKWSLPQQKPDTPEPVAASSPSSFVLRRANLTAPPKLQDAG